jgi:outer membrane protein assembly factor BamE (lipoprotein component of BamABCDE complex)
MPRSNRPFRHAAAALLLVLLAGCDLPAFLSFPLQVRGSKVDADQVKELVPGTTTRQDVTSLLGSPTAKATFDDNTWIYISQLTKPIIGGTQAVEDQHVLVLTFDQGGILRNIDTKSRDDSKSVTVVSRTTPSPGSEASFLQQLLGNVGKFSPLPTNTGTGSGGSGSGLSAGGS